MQHTQDYNKTFIKQKVNEIKIALFKTEEANLEPLLPNNVITTLNVDEDGTVWFLTAYKGIDPVKLFGVPFFACLNYYKKDSDCHLTLTGKATIELHMPLCSKKAAKENYKMVLVSMKIIHAEFYEKKMPTNLSWPQKIKSAFNHLFIPYPRIYHFS